MLDSGVFQMIQEHSSFTEASSNSCNVYINWRE